VASGDVTIARNHFSGFTPLELITPPASAPGPLGGAPLVAAPVLAAESQAASSGTPAATGLAECSATAHDAIFSQNLDRWDLRLYADLAWSWELARPRPKQRPSEGDFSSQEVRPWMFSDYGR